MTAITDRLLDTIKVHAPGASPNTIHHELMNAITEFCRNSLAWREIGEVNLISGQRVYDIAPAGTTIVSFLSLSHETVDLGGIMFQYGKLTFGYSPSAADIAQPMYVSMALAPLPIPLTDNVETLLPEDVWNDYEDAFRAGTIARLLQTPSKPYTNLQLGVMHRRDFWSKIAQARQRVRVGAQVGVQNWRFPRFT